jgi:predicted permease
MLRDDLRGAVRHTLRRPLFAFGVTAALAVSIGAATTAFGLARAVLWRPLPFADASRLVFVWEDVTRNGEHHPSRVTGFRYTAWRDQHQERSPFSSMALFGAAGFTLDTPGGAESVRGVRVSAGYFATLGITPMLGRTFVESDETPGSHRVVILSHGFWRERFGDRRDAVGATLNLSGEPHIVVGVMRQGVYPGWPVNPAVVTIDAESQQLWVPLPRTPQLEQNGRAHVFGVVARLSPGVSEVQALDTLNRTTDPSAPDSHGAHITPLREQFVRNARTPLIALIGTALAVLLIACANLASLHVSAFEARRAEFSLRAAIGASVTRLVGQVGLEALAPALVGGLAGIALARGALAALPALLPRTVPFLTAPGLDFSVAAFAMALAVLAAVMTTAWPTTRLVRSTPAPRGVTQRPRRSVYRVLVVGQVAAAVALISAAGLLARSLKSVQSREPGFIIDNVLVGEIALPASSPPNARRIAATEQALLAAVASVPRVIGVASAYDHPFEANWSETPTIVGDTTLPEERRDAELRIVSPGYFEAMGVEVLDGRGLTERDDLDGPGAVVINETFAQEIGGHVLGRRLQSATPRLLYGSTAPDEFEIVGVVKNERFRGLEAPRQRAFYLSTRQFPQADFSILVRTSADPLRLAADVRSAIHLIDRAITFSRPTSLDRILAEQLAGRRVTTGVIGGFAGAALGLAGLGLYGLLAVLVASRSREIGVRLALGASPRGVAWSVFHESVLSTAVGVAIGSILAFAAGRLIDDLLVGVSASDPLTLATVAATLFAVSITAAFGPARRAARMDPAEALRAE